MSKSSVYLGLGSNIGDRQQMLSRALTQLSYKVKVEAISSFYETSPQYVIDQPKFLNAVCRISTTLSPHQLLTLIKGIESKLGRSPNTHNQPRLIDIDILMYDNIVMQDPTLTTPHPRMLERAFVLIPLAEIAPDLVHPIVGLSIRELAGKMSQEGLVKIGSTLLLAEGA